MVKHRDILDVDLFKKLKSQNIQFGGNRRLKIYGKLSCSSGKRMKKENRVFFSSEEEAIRNNYRPCGHCMKAQYKMWKNEAI